jgi:hypothetical protein
MEDGFEDAVADKTNHHPVESDECHRTIGVVDDDLGSHAIQ